MVRPGEYNPGPGRLAILEVLQKCGMTPLAPLVDAYEDAEYFGVNNPPNGYHVVRSLMRRLVVSGFVVVSLTRKEISSGKYNLTTKRNYYTITIKGTKLLEEFS